MFKIKFSTILGLSTLLVALCAAFFSVYGIGTLFAGASISAIIMASSLEIGKLVGTTFLYRYWRKCKTFLKSYLTIAISILMIITSMGIFGYLSSAYQKSSIEFGVVQEKIVALESQKNYSKDKIESSKKRIQDLVKIRDSQESRMNNTLTNEYVSRNPLQLKQLQQQTVDLISSTDTTIKDENQKIQLSIDDIGKIDTQINELKLGTASKKDVQTFKFVADALHLPLDQVVRWFIICIIFVFDPLAVGLTLAYNIAVYKKEDEELYDNTPTKKITKETNTPKIVEDVVSVPEISAPKIENPPVEEIKVEKPNPHMDDWFRKMFKIS